MASICGRAIHIPVTMDIRIYVMALALALLGGLLFGIVPVGLVMQVHPYEVVKAGSTGRVWRKVTARDVLQVAQIGHGFSMRMLSSPLLRHREWTLWRR